MRTFLVTFLFTTYRHNIFHLPYFSTPFTDLTSVHVVINSCPSDYPPTVHGTSMCLPLEASSTTGSPLLPSVKGGKGLFALDEGFAGLGKEYSASQVTTTTSLASVFYRALGKIFAEYQILLSAWRKALGQHQAFAECRILRHSAKDTALPSVRKFDTRQNPALYWVLKIWHSAKPCPLPSAKTQQSLALCWVSKSWHSAKTPAMPSVNVMTLGKEPAMPSALTFALGITGKMIFFIFFCFILSIHHHISHNSHRNDKYTSKIIYIYPSTQIYHIEPSIITHKFHRW